MRRIAFGWDDGENSKELLWDKIDKVSVSSIGGNIPVSFTLWFGLTGIRIYSDVYEIGERNEVGYLKFKTVSNPLDADIFIKNDNIEPNRRINKLLIEEKGILVECGMEFIGSQSIFILAGAQPFTIAASFLEKAGYLFDPAYELSEYKKENFERSGRQPPPHG